MDVILVVLGLICSILGLLGSFLPALPGAPLSWIGLLLLYLTDYVENNYWVLGITLLLTIIVSILDYTIPAQGTKKFGGTKYGVWGTNIGLIVGLFFPPIGFIIGLFVGAFIGELIYNFQDKKGALKAAFGAFLGFLVSSFMKFMLCFSFLILFLFVAIKNY
ncbi:DUF456 domain-containing protein [Flavobacterium aquatile]|uniref:Membrane protein n=1 Tax=Flavobacterium aquatile LMG 4008 = ATCC 11947 TaxID=1453498 RepID=A0A095SSG4_9FLAO|nr:DUF456 domain-containing protein [Flavobacterium aquatile]KGD67309.1 membrane protein [Flavobacterium aquatile LMG 4008 = ATCC 11947]OXA66789.1 hypothetical protein B0A61_10005 [Flavobacterium aquatile LMG 4008 = ATCC 11947]GEC78515.1 membrane protein [Flavobacterium aquatile]